METPAQVKAPLDVIITVRIETALRDDLAALAARAEREFAQEVRRGLRRYVLSETLVADAGEAA